MAFFISPPSAGNIFERIDYMSTNETFNFVTERLFENAVKEFRSTEQYQLLKEKREQMERDCKYNLTDEGKEFTFECFDLLLSIEGQETRYVYNKGLLDCVALLKWLGVLA